MSAAAFRFRPRVEPLDGSAGALDLVEALARLAPHVDAPVLFDGGLGVRPAFSVLAFDPLPVRTPRTLAGLGSFVARLRSDGGDAVPGPFHGGFSGALAYELGAAAESGLALPRDPWRLPAILGGLYTDFLVRDDERGATWLVLGDAPGDGRPALAERSHTLRRALSTPVASAPVVPRGPLQRLVSAAEHGARVERAREWIAAGEIYQANLSMRFERAVHGDPLALYRRLRALHPAPCAGFLRRRNTALLSVSPELLLEVRRGDEGLLARTRPIKGTIARGRDPAEDAAQAARLLASQKDLAELAMIVDLERNDLGRVARAGSVRVEGFPRLESYASVHHLVADVCADLRGGVDALGALRSIYPGGSVTGAPKLRSMEAIAELEGEGRGHAYGSLLWLDTRGELRASLLIRTLIWRATDARGAGEVTFRVGGGITWGSVAEDEEREAEAKGRLLALALEPEHASHDPAVEGTRATGCGVRASGTLSCSR